MKPPTFNREIIGDRRGATTSVTSDAQHAHAKRLAAIRRRAPIVRARHLEATSTEEQAGSPSDGLDELPEL